MTKIDFVRQLLAKNPDATASQVKDQLEKQGITENYFSVLKNTLKGEKAPAPVPAKVRQPRKGKTEPAVAVTVEESVKFVTDAGGVTQAQAQVAALEKLLTDFTALSNAIGKEGGEKALAEKIARQRQMLASFTAIAALIGKTAA